MGAVVSSAEPGVSPQGMRTAVGALVSMAPSLPPLPLHPHGIATAGLCALDTNAAASAPAPAAPAPAVCWATPPAGGSIAAPVVAPDDTRGFPSSPASSAAPASRRTSSSFASVPMLSRRHGTSASTSRCCSRAGAARERCWREFAGARGCRSAKRPARASSPTPSCGHASAASSSARAGASGFGCSCTRRLTPCGGLYSTHTWPRGGYGLASARGSAPRRGERAPHKLRTVTHHVADPGCGARAAQADVLLRPLRTPEGGRYATSHPTHLRQRARRRRALSESCMPDDEVSGLRCCSWRRCETSVAHCGRNAE